jgi:hypothetical protein
MATGASLEAEYAIQLEERAHALRIAMLTDQAFVDGVLAGHRQARAGETPTLEELDRALGLD